MKLIFSKYICGEKTKLEKIIINELEQKNLFRTVNAKIHINEKINNQNFDSDFFKKILDQYKVYINNNKIKLSIKELECLSLEELIKFITMVSPFSYLEKQSCLESENVNDFANKLFSILKIYSNLNSSRKDRSLALL